jgi:hypothetical protein
MGSAFDLCVVYYGDGPGEAGLRSLATHFFHGKGSKYQNLHRLWSENPGFIEGYRSVFLVDDDLIFDGRRIRALFDTLRRHDLFALQPAFLPESRITLPGTRMEIGTELRRTSMIESTAILIRTDLLVAFLDEYDARVAAWGVDQWLAEFLERIERGRMAIVDRHPCINPRHEVAKGGVREIDRLQPPEQRRDTWHQVARERGLRGPRWTMREYSRLRLPPLARARSAVMYARSRLRAERAQAAGSPSGGSAGMRRWFDRLRAVLARPVRTRRDLEHLVADLAREREGIRAELQGVYARLDELEASQASLETTRGELATTRHSVASLEARLPELDAAAQRLSAVEADTGLLYDALEGASHLARASRRRLIRLERLAARPGDRIDDTDS